MWESPSKTFWVDTLGSAGSGDVCGRQQGELIDRCTTSMTLGCLPDPSYQKAGGFGADLAPRRPGPVRYLVQPFSIQHHLMSRLGYATPARAKSLK